MSVGPNETAALDLVDDRALEQAADDRFGHADFASQTAAMLKAVRTPANVAIYAPWGSGKTSLANMLRQDIGTGSCGFVYFDAFKYAETPLRREFIRRVARALEVKGDDFDRGLYEEEVRSGFALRKAALKPLLQFLGWTAGAAVALTVIISVVLAWLSHKAFWPEWVDDVKRLLPAIFAPSVLVSPIIALARQQLEVTRTRYAPQSDEEFESLFRRVVRTAFDRNKNWDRIVFFIDELDRCSAGEVASTLETLRTFLEVEGCVFVVAADRQVLETAIARESRQETPPDRRNPYYSVGSSYLDKIFQYQWQLPPMMPSSLARFAQTLVEKRTSGVWSEVDPGQIVSVLVPLHVQSPRRVKELLNAFAMAYRVAERRFLDGHLEGDLRARSTELAKLVCLQLEFPIFGSDLPNEPRFPELVLTLSDDRKASRPPGVPEPIWLRARQYAGGDAPLDVIISQPAENSLDTESSAEDGVSRDGEIRQTQADLLVRYLQKTRRVPGPAADLIFLEGAGFAFDLPTSLASRLRSAAAEGRTSDVLAAVREVSPAQQISALRLLALQVREALPGIEGGNSVSTLLGLVGALSEIDVSSVVDELVDALNTSLQDEILPDEEIQGAILLGLRTTRPVGRELTDRALAQDVILEDPAVAAFVARHADSFPAEQIDRLGQVVAALLVDLDWPDASATVLGWSDRDAVALLGATKQPMLDAIRRANEPEPDASTTASTAPTSEADPQAVTEAEEEDEVEEEEAEEEGGAGVDAEALVLPELAGLIEASREAGRTVLLEALLELTLGIDSKDARNLVVPELAVLGSVASSSLTSALLAAAELRAISDKPKWLDPLVPRIVGAIPNSGQVLHEILVGSWADGVSAIRENEAEDVETFLHSVARLALTDNWDSASLVSRAVLPALAAPDGDEESLRDWLAKVDLARMSEKEGLVKPDEWRATFVAACVEVCSFTPADDAARTLARGCLLDVLPGVVEHVPSGDLSKIDDSIATSTWLSEPERYLVRVRLAAGLKELNPELPSPVTAAELLALEVAAAEEEAESVWDAVGTWLGELHPSVEDAWTVLARFLDVPLPASVRVGMDRYAASLEPGQRTALIGLALADFPGTKPTEEFLEAALFHESEMHQSAKLVKEMLGRARNEEHRRFVVRLWSAMRLTDKEVERELLSEVMLPLVTAGKTSREIVLQNLNLVQALPNKDRRELAEAFEAAAKGEEWNGVRRRLVQAGLMREKGVLKRRVEHLAD